MFAPRSSIAVLCAVLCPLTPAQEEAADKVLEGHSYHGAEFNDGPRQRAYLMDGMNPDVHFEIESRSLGAHAFFDQGIVQLHGFWYFEAERSFRQVAAMDPDCAMAYWGMAMANFENDERAHGFAWQAWRRRDNASPRGQMYIEALARYFGTDVEPDKEDPTQISERKKLGDLKQRRKRFIEDLEEIVFDFPDDIEAKAFLVNQLWLDRRKGMPTSSRQANQALLDQVFAKVPSHPAHHYRIHLWDSSKTAKRVVDSAARSGPAAPGIAHLWHMQGHIWDKLDRFAEAAWSQEASARVDHAHMMRDQVLPDQIHNFAHNNEWLTRSLRSVGRVRDAIDLARNMVELPRHPKHNDPKKSGNSSNYGRRRLLEVLRMYEQWDQLLDVCRSSYLEPTGEIEDESRRHHLVGLAHAGRGDVDAVEAQIGKLEDLLARAKSDRAAAVDAAEEKALGENKGDADVKKALQQALDSFAGPIKGVRRNIDQLDALVAFAAGEHDAAIGVLEKARFGEIPLSRLCLVAGKNDKALELARKARKGKDGEALPIANLAWVLHSTGKADEAKRTFAELREISARFDLDVPAFARLAPMAAEQGLPSDWRLAKDLPAELVGDIELADLGPFRWTPPPAAPFTLPDGFGGRISLADYEGRPVLLIFFLGFGCVHCVEQLQAFRPMTVDYEAAGIPIVAIGTDSIAQLNESQKDDTADDRYPFPILADPELGVFKSYRAFDDFEGQALHGTFLIDGAGRIRFIDISYEPFMEAEFLLKESKRLLGLTDATAPGASGSRER